MKFICANKARTTTAAAMRAAASAAAAAGFAAGIQAQDLPEFEHLPLDDQFTSGVGIDIADIDGDGLPDVIAWASSPGQLVWYRNPDWNKFTITTALQDIIDGAPQDIDGDGDIDVALAHDFSLGNYRGGGVLHWLENPGDPEAAQETGRQWTAHYIDETPTSHRILWADLNGDGRRELVNLPIIGTGAEAPLYDVGLELKAYPLPEDLAVARWNGVVLDRGLELSHGMTAAHWDEDDPEDLLTASFGGVHLFQLATMGEAVAKSRIGAGLQGPERPNIGSSEVAVGGLPRGDRFIATIEPWHGNQVVVYAGDEPLWNRLEIDDRLAAGHGLVTADLNDDEIDEIIAGGRGEPYQLAIYQYDESSGRWRREDLSGEVAVSGLAAADVDGDGDTDIAAVGAASGNIILYLNQGR